MSIVQRILIRNILNSNGDFAVEADVQLLDGTLGRGASSAAILPGRREKGVTRHKEFIDYYRKAVTCLEGYEYDQKEWDFRLGEHIEDWGTDVTLALSLAFARAEAQVRGDHLTEYLRKCGDLKKRETSFFVLVPIFSAGVHAPELEGSLQQIMIAVLCEDIMETVVLIQSFYTLLEKELRKKGNFAEYSSSSGFLTKGMDAEEQLAFLTEKILKEGLAERVTIALDVAAEHMFTGEKYRVYGKLFAPDVLENMLRKWAFQYPISYIEDPFDASDGENWESLRHALEGRAGIWSDDLSATQIQFLDCSVSDGIILKMKQVGTISATLEMGKTAKARGMQLCVSHRSYETEDTAVCDLGVAIGADYMKIGGPRRGDRTEKYNQLIRILGR